MEWRTGRDQATGTERAVVDALLGPPPSPWVGGARSGPALHVARRTETTGAARTHLLPLLRALRQRVGFVSPGAVHYLAVRLSVPPSEIYGVASFYALLDTEPTAPVVLHACDDIACRLGGAERLKQALERRYGAEGHANGSVTWRSSPCLGQCDRGPAVFVQRAGPEADDGVLAPVTADTLDAVVEAAPEPPATVTGSGPFVLSRVGRVNPDDIDSYRAHGGYEALRVALRLGPDGVIRWMTAAELKGRGGAAFPTGAKWQAVAAQPVRPHYVVANADESEPGTFKDRVLMEEDPFAIVEGLTIAGYATGAERGYIYVRGEYPLAARRLHNAVDRARQRGLLGRDILQRGFHFEIEIRQGAGAYICGEETALFNSIEGRRGEPRNKPPFPTRHGLFGKPTAINNVETLVNVLAILTRGVEAFTSVGTEEARGTRLFSVSGAVVRPGLYEVPFGTPLRDLLALAGGLPPGRRVEAILLGGAAGTFVGPEALATPLTPSAVRSIGGTLGSGVVVVFDDAGAVRDAVLRIARFFRDESCGQCVPCRVGTVRQEELVTRLAAGRPLPSLDAELGRFRDLAAVMRDASICGLGQTAPSAVESAIRLGFFGHTKEAL
jgi:NADH-quinone oxidoreductase subunit F